MRRTRYACTIAAGCVLWVVVSGCVLGPTALDVSRVRYNQVIQKTTSEQLLLNLVRLQYRENPLFLGVGSVSASFRFADNAGISGTINEGPGAINPDQLGLSAGVTYEEKPTITFAPLQGREFVSQILSPLSLDAILLLAHSGWSADRALRLTVKTINGLDNASTASGPTPGHAPHYEEFARVTGLMRRLQKEGLLHIGYETHDKDLAVPIPMERVNWLDVIEASNHGYSARMSADDQSLILTESSRTLVWRIPPTAKERPEVKELVELLGLDPNQSEYEIQISVGGQPDLTVSPGQRTKINIATRSLMGTLFYLSQAVQVPDTHREKGVVTTTRTADGAVFDWTQVTGDLLRIHSQRTPPSRAAVAVFHRGYWFYIDDADLTSKSTFGFLSQLFALQAGAIESAAPVLTLPVGG